MKILPRAVVLLSVLAQNDAARINQPRVEKHKRELEEAALWDRLLQENIGSITGK